MTASLAAQILLAFSMGLLGSLHCIGMCGGLVTAVSFSRPRIWWFGLFLYQLGRVTTYAVLGIVVSFAGIALNRVGGNFIQGLLAILAGGLMTLFAIYLAGWLPDPLRRIAALTSKQIGLASLAKRVSTDQSTKSWYLLGMANGLLPCGLVYAALALALSADHAITAMLMMIGFGVGTIPAMMLVPSLMRRMSPDLRNSTMKVAALLIFLLGVFTILRGGMGMH